MIALVSAPSNLGLRPSEPGGFPGTCKAPEALREAGLHARLAAAGATDAGIVLPGRYVDDDRSRPAGRIRNENALVEHAHRLAARIGSIFEAGDAPLVLGGDCSLLLSAGLALAGGGAGLVHLDGHTDFRHPGNSDQCASLAGEDLAAAVGLHWPAVADIDDVGPYFRPRKVAHVGCRNNDEHFTEATSVLGSCVSAGTAMTQGMTHIAETSAKVAGGRGYWLQLDVDLLDPQWMPAVDSPSPGGLHPDELVELLAALAPGAVGATVTVFDPDLDPDGSYASMLTDVLVRGLGTLGCAAGRARVGPTSSTYPGSQRA